MAINEEKFYYNLSQQTQHAHTTHLNSPFDLLIHHIARNVRSEERRVGKEC